MNFTPTESEQKLPQLLQETLNVEKQRQQESLIKMF